METAAKDSCIRLWQLSFVVAAARAQPERDVTGGKHVDNPRCMILTCEVAASAHEGGALNKSKKKVIAWRSDQKSKWLDVLVAWVTRANLEAEDQNRSSTKDAGGRVGKK